MGAARGQETPGPAASFPKVDMVPTAPPWAGHPLTLASPATHHLPCTYLTIQWFVLLFLVVLSALYPTLPTRGRGVITQINLIQVDNELSKIT